MTFTNLTDDGAILGELHTAKDEALNAATSSAKNIRARVRTICYGAAGEVKWWCETLPNTAS